MSKSVNCSYHPDTTAVTKCERCYRLICVNDKRIYRKTISSGTGNHRHSRTEIYEYCPVCNSEQKISDATGPAAMFGSAFLIIFGFFWISFAGVAFPPFIIGLGLIIYGIYNIATGPQKAEAARNEQTRFLNSLTKSPSGISSIEQSSKLKPYVSRKKWSNQSIHCFECGNEIKLADDYCMECGDSTIEEREELSKSG